MARILVIDDDGHVRAQVSDMLSAAGHAVSLVDNGRAGLSRYRDDHPDLVITDIFMPERNGLDVILELAPRNVHIIAMSERGDLDPSDHLDDAINFGARCSLKKPFTRDALIEAVNTALAI
jgi:DNA-binding NtrC family response regulator